MHTSWLYYVDMLLISSLKNLSFQSNVMAAENYEYKYIVIDSFVLLAHNYSGFPATHYKPNPFLTTSRKTDRSVFVVQPGASAPSS